MLFAAVMAACALHMQAWADDATHWNITSGDYINKSVDITSGTFYLGNGSNGGAGSGDANTVFTSGGFTIEDGAILQIHGWTGTNRTIETNGKLQVASDISIAAGGTLRLEDGSYYFTKEVNIGGTAEKHSVIHSEWDKGFVFDKLTGDTTAVLDLTRNSGTPHVIFTLQGDGGYAGRINVGNNDKKLYLSINSAGALADTASINLNKANSVLALNVESETISGMGGTGAIQLVKGDDSIAGNATTVSASTLNISNAGTGTDVFSGTIGSGITINIKKGSSQEFGLITNNGSITVEDGAKYVVTAANNHAGFIADESMLMDLQGNLAAKNGFASGNTFNLFEGNGTSPSTVYYKGESYTVTNGQITVEDYEASYDKYYINGTASQADVNGAKAKATENGKTLEIIINDGGVLQELTHDGGTPFFAGDVTIKGGGTIKLGNDVLGWSASMPHLILIGESEEKKAVAQLTGSVTAGCDNSNNRLIIDMKGNALISDDGTDGRFIDTLQVAINSTGTGNEISADIRDRGGIVFNTAAGSDLIVSGKVIERGSNLSGTSGTIKQGAGAVDFTAQGSTFSGKVEVQAGRVSLAGAGTTLKGGAQIDGDARLTGDAKTVLNNGVVENGIVTINGNVTLNGYLTGQSGTLRVTGNIDGNGNVELGKDASDSTQIILSGATNTFKTFDLSNGGKAHGSVVLKNGTNTQLTGSGGGGALWMNAGTSVLLEENASLTLNNYGVTITGSGSTDDMSSVAAIIASEDKHQTPDVASATIKNSTLAITKDTEYTVQAQLANSAVTNNGTGKLTVNNSANTLTAVNAAAGDVKVVNTSTEQVSIGSITVNSGRKVEAEVADLSLNSLTLNGGTMTTTGSLTIGTLVLDLNQYTDMAAQYTLVTSGGENAIVTLTQAYSAMVGEYTATVSGSGTSSLTLSFEKQQQENNSITTTVSGVKGVFNAEENMLTLNVNAALDGVDSVLISGIESDIMKDILGQVGLPLDGMVNISLFGTDGTTFVADAEGKLSFLAADGVGTYGGAVGTGSWQYNVNYIPEPATATLSLLALAGLAARRRRK